MILFIKWSLTIHFWRLNEKDHSRRHHSKLPTKYLLFQSDGSTAGGGIIGDHKLGQVSLTKGRKKKIIILDYKNWQIVLEPNFPSHNYILTKKNASHSFKPAYCGTLESALNMLFEQLMIANIEKNGGYGKKFADLHNVLIETKKEFKELISLDVRKPICGEGGVFS